MEFRDGREECGNPHQDKPLNVKKTRSPLLIPKGNRGDYMRIFLSASGNADFLLACRGLPDVFLFRGLFRFIGFFRKLFGNVRQNRLFSAVRLGFGELGDACRRLCQGVGFGFRRFSFDRKGFYDAVGYQSIDFRFHPFRYVLRGGVFAEFRKRAYFGDFGCRGVRVVGCFYVLLRRNVLLFRRYGGIRSASAQRSRGNARGRASGRRVSPSAAPSSG